jgi:hypothetical protein
MDLRRLAAGTILRPVAAPPPVELAASELGRYLGRLFGNAPAERTADGPPGAWLRLAPTAATLDPARIVLPPPDVEWTITPAGDEVVLAGATPRALLAAAYALLEHAGCRWSPWGADDETLPATPERRVERFECRPAFERRAYAADLQTWHYTMPERLAARLPGDVAFVDWMAKTGATGFHYIRHANDTQWSLPELDRELARRGLAVELGGHALVDLLPRALFESHPEWFPLDASGRRSDFGNVCVASAAALATVRERARDLHAAGDLHLWGLDLVGGGWCNCDACRPLTPSEQALVVSNAVAGDLPVGARVFHLAYHDTLEPPRTVRADARVWAEFAPRERCFGHALDDPACPTNPGYRKALEEHVERFEGRVEVFEYYGDAILFGGCAVPLVEVCARDLDYYRRAGVRGVACLVFGRYSLWAHGATIEAFARGAVEPAGARAVTAAHCARRHGDGAIVMARYLAALEAMMAEVVTWGDVKLPPPTAAVETALEAALGAAPAVRRLLDDAVASGAPATLVRAEARLLDYTFATLAAVRDWVVARRSGNAGEPALAALAEAVGRVADVDLDVKGSWGAYDLEIANAFYVAALGAEPPAG